MKKIRFQTKDRPYKWSKWYESSKVKIPDEIIRCEISETMTLAEVKKHFPEYEN